MIKLETLYKIDSVGKLREWSVHVEGNTFYAVKGLVGMKLITDTPTLCVAKNVGRSNETTPEEQAEIEAKGKWDRRCAGSVPVSSRFRRSPPMPVAGRARAPSEHSLFCSARQTPRQRCERERVRLRKE